MVNWKNVLGTSLLSTGLVFSSFAPATFAKSTNVAKVPYSNVLQTPEGSTLPFLGKHTGGPFDIGLVNEDKVLKLLIDQGIVNKDASPQEQQKQMNAYFAKRAAKANVAGTNQQEVKQIRTQLQEKAKLKIKDAGVPKANKASKTNVSKPVTSSKVDPIQKETWAGPERKDKVLVLLVDYPDAPHSTIKDGDGAVLQYEDYTQQHYKDMIFGDDGYEGPNGENLVSVKQYYEEQSGGSYTIDGQVSKWYTASQPAAYYGGNVPAPDGNDAHPRSLVKEALAQAAQDPDINLQDYDIQDEFDLDGDGNYFEPDGIIDHLMVVHSGIGEEAGGGQLGGDAIWSHSSALTDLQGIPNSQSTVPYWKGQMIAYGYTIEPEDGAAGVFAHEFGHDLGLPDEYDTMYTHNSVGAPTEYWTIMSAGSWAGKINGTEPTGFSPYDKEYLQSTMPGSNWFKNEEYDLADLASGKTVKLDQASEKGTNADAVKINLPDKSTTINTPSSGQFEYFSGSEDELNNAMTVDVDLTGKTSAELSFKTWYKIEDGFDYAYVEVKEEGAEKYVSIPGNITTNDNPYQANAGNGITGDSNGWKDASFDLSTFAGKKVSLKFHYVQDAGVSLPGLYVDDVKVTADGADVLTDDAEGATSPFLFDGFEKNNGIKLSTQYYLAEWRSHAGSDKGLATTTRGKSQLTYDPGLVLWYVDNKYTDNWVGDHPGDGFLGVVDAHQETAIWKDSNFNDGRDVTGPVATRYQIQDAAFSLNKTDKLFLDYGYGFMSLGAQPAVTAFDDSRDYSNPGQIYSGRNVPKYGLKIHVVGQADDMSVGAIEIHTGSVHSVDVNPLSKAAYSNQAGHKELTVSGKVHHDGSGESVALKYELVDKNGKVVLTESETLTGTDKSFERTLTLPTSATGNYVVKVTATDEDGNAVSGQTSFGVDNDAPTASVAPNGSTTPAKEVAAKVTVKDAEASSLEYVWSQSATVPATGWSKFTNGSTLKLSGKNGLWYLHVRGLDAVGNALKWTSKSFALDNLAPSTPTVYEVKDYDKKVTGKAEVGSKVTVKVGSTTVGTAYADKYGKFSVTLKKALSAKTVVSVTATDKAGNVSKSATTTVKDKTKPGKPSVKKVDSNDLKVTGKAEAGATVTVKAGSKTVGTAVSNSKGEYSVKLKKALKTGTVLTVTAKDKAGNTSSATTVKVVKK
ncbi:immune inhibitor A [Bacillus sp. sid0103]|uniref:immune inhibitor A domain-containing protein n=1 Tax=Bacillus sp. sid0103 TaxID=2856337 RepID=UPI001C48B105|nr:immune inhibitor A domain-containing protein [Bacillus sp. sid0103]MBV7505095.1 immune inhibitor A [Bacillus sp. sid0103]